MLSEYIGYIPYFLAFVSLGVMVNLLFFPNDDTSTKRIAREILGAFWVSLIVFAIIDQWFDLNLLITLAFCSLGGFFNSRIITFLKKDLLEFVLVKLKELVGKFFEWVGSKFKKRDDE